MHSLAHTKHTRAPHPFTVFSFVFTIFSLIARKIAILPRVHRFPLASLPVYQSFELDSLLAHTQTPFIPVSFGSQTHSHDSQSRTFIHSRIDLSLALSLSLPSSLSSHFSFVLSFSSLSDLISFFFSFCRVSQERIYMCLKIVNN